MQCEVLVICFMFCVSYVDSYVGVYIITCICTCVCVCSARYAYYCHENMSASNLNTSSYY